jgi:RNA polymerase sigma-70 factor (ECF subfamily)
MDGNQTFEYLQAACAGDRKAFTALVHSQGLRLYAIAVRITRDPTLAEDVVQDCFLRILGGYRSIRKVTAVEAWLAQVAARRAIDLLRSREAGRKREENYAMAHQGFEDRPEEKVLGEEVSSAVSEALGVVPAEVRAAILLHVVEGQTVREVGASLGIARSTVSDQIRDGIAEIRKFLKGKGLLALAALPPADLLGNLPKPAFPPVLVARLEELEASAATSGESAAAAGIPGKGTGLAAFGFVTPAAAKVFTSIGVGLILVAATVLVWKALPTGPDDKNHPLLAVTDPVLSSPEGAKLDDPPRASDGAPPPPAAPAPAPRAAMTVRVVDEDGNPTAGARVKVVWTEPVKPGKGDPRLPPGLQSPRLRNTTKEIQLEPSPTGEFACRERQGSEVIVFASCPGFHFRTEMVEVPEGGLEAPVVVALEKGKPFSGRVVDAGNGDVPVEGTRIGIGDPTESSPLDAFDTRIEPEEPPPELFHSVTSGPDGRFTITGVQGDLWVLREGYGPTVFAMGWECPWEEEDEHRVPLLPPTRIRLSVRTADGDPGPSFEYRLGEGMPREPTDPRWIGRKVKGSEADIALAHHARIAGGQAVLREMATASVRLVLPKTPGSPAGANDPDKVKAFGSKSWKIHYGEENKIEIVVGPREAAGAGPAPDPAGRPATLHSAGGGKDERESPGPAGAEAAPGPAADGITLIGKVVGDGKPVAGLNLSLNDDPVSKLFAGAKTSEDGSFRMEGIPPGRHTLTLVDRDFSPHQLMIDVEPGMGPVEIDASRRSIEGFVRSADGPVPDAKIEVLTELNREGWIGWAPFRSDGTGRFRIAGLYLRRYVFILEKEGCLRRPILLDLTGPTGVARQDILLEKAGDRGTMRLHVLDGETGEAVPGTVAVVFANIDGAIFPIAHAGGKEGGGRYEIEGLPSGTYRARIFGEPGLFSRYAAEIYDIEHQDGNDRVNPLRLRPGGSLTVRISTPDGRVPDSSSIEVLSSDGTQVPINPSSAKEKNMACRFQRTITLPGLPAGDCWVRVGSEGRDPVEKSVKIDPGHTAVLVVESP